MILKTLAVLFGIVFLAMGILGFIPTISPDGMLFWIFKVNPLHNVIHLITGLVALWVGSVSERGSKIYFQVFGIIYALVAVLGFGYGSKHIFNLISSNMANSWLHLVLAVFALYFGFGIKTAPASKSKR